jgi:hypothetical protein
MENCSIPNSNQAIGPISTPWLAPSKKSNSAPEEFFGALGLTIAAWSWVLKPFNTQRSTLNTQLRKRSRAGRSIQTVGRWVLDVRSWAFSFSVWRVKGAWWPSRSSKPLSARKSRGRFDSCPLRSAFVSQSETTARPRRSSAKAGNSKVVAVRYVGAVRAGLAFHGDRAPWLQLQHFEGR